MATETIRGKHLVILYDGKLCIHSRNCILNQPEVFVPNVEGEWIHPDDASTEDVVMTARMCPSGAIRYQRLDGGEEEPAPEVNTARLRENGPLAFNAPLEIAGEAAGLRRTLCRCGLSKHKPYCDNSHVEGGFHATGEPATKKSGPLAARDGVLAVEPQRNGPLKVSGNLEIVSGTGRTIDRVTETWLCRCGHSQNKPYCDGSHLKSGFEADGT
ncbi:CDGSH iron-sulfur domain-containing protein [Solilutibacter silvestris]|uniref:Iron-binding zinc finger CDGSH type domain-containing protein n=1 Tax=Solilutibacter silvestris TaxID=1645665 RepID=A0A2K1Q479_9GAMM|nr:CDGSH iron-sulfur domain-containing protein [Lysobacter silvestris]PNS09811.1 hypothetical protein Lysil_1440 [Lysobacter silvestris]